MSAISQFCRERLGRFLIILFHVTVLRIHLCTIHTGHLHGKDLGHVFDFCILRMSHTYRYMSIIILCSFIDVLLAAVDIYPAGTKGTSGNDIGSPSIHKLHRIKLSGIYFQLVYKIRIDQSEEQCINLSIVSTPFVSFHIHTDFTAMCFGNIQTKLVVHRFLDRNIHS